MKPTARLAACFLAAAAALVGAGEASEHARVSPAVSVAKQLQLYSLAVPTEKAGAATTTVTLTVPAGFSIDSFAPSPGWRRSLQETGTGDSAVVQKVTWTGGKVPTGEDSVFQFLAQPAASGTYTFEVEQTYSDGSVVEGNGPESAEDPAPAIEVKSSLGGGGTSTLALIALVVAALARIVAGAGLLARGAGGRPLA